LVDFIENRMQDFLMIFTLFGSFLWLMLVGELLSPEVANILGPAGYFAIIFAGIFGTEIVVREIVNSYPYIRMIVRPTNEEYDLYVLKGGKEQRLGGGWHAAQLTLRFAEEMEGYGKVDELKLRYYKKWSDRIRFMRGQAFWRGFMVAHPQTETIIAYQTPKASTSIDHGKMIPTFTIHNASRDFYSMSDPILENAEFAEVPSTDEGLREQYSKLLINYKNLKAVYDEANSRSQESHQKFIAAEDIVEQQRTEQRGLLSAKTGAKDIAVGMFLGFLHATSSIEEGLKQLRGPKEVPFLNKYIVTLILVIAGFVFLTFNPAFASGFASWMGNPINQLFLFGIGVLAVVAIYLIIRKGKAKA